MTRDEAGERYSIPHEILLEYESWGLGGGTDRGQYDDADLERLSTIMTLYDLGFSSDEARAYMCLAQRAGSVAERLRMLDRKRRLALDEIHSREKKLELLDYLRHELASRA